MSGIFGLFHRNFENLDVEVLESMGKSMLHRGPDGVDTWAERNMGLGNCQMHTTPESAGEKLPYYDRDRDLVIAADARIDGRKELAVKLGISPSVIKYLSDARLILAAYSKWREKCVHHLLGDFSFLIWDRARQELFCARDHLGVKPFYYHQSDKIFAVASEVSAILKIPQVPKSINDARIADFLVRQLEGIDHTSTFYQSILRLPPAHTLLISERQKVIQRYWHLDPETEVQYNSDDAYVEAFDEIFQKSVADRLRSNGLVTSMLSGGVDSSYVVGTAKKFLRDRSQSLPVYSGISTQDKNCRETYFINKVVEQGGVSSIAVDPSAVSNYEKELLALDAQTEELFDAEMTLPMLLYLMARDRGQRVMLDGVEGDFVHSLGVSYPGSLLRSGQPVKAITEGIGIWSNTYGRRFPLGQTLFSSMRTAIAPQLLHKWRRGRLPKQSLDRRLKGSLINREFAEACNIESRLDQLRTHDTRGDPATLREIQIRNIMHPYLVVALERYDRVAARCGIEPRHPLLDKRLVEYSVSLPWDQKARNGWSKYAVRRACEKTVSKEVAWRRGWDDICWSFSASLIEASANVIDEQIASHRDRLSQYIEPVILKRIVNNSRELITSGQEDSVWDVFRIANWLEYNSH